MRRTPASILSGTRPARRQRGLAQVEASAGRGRSCTRAGRPPCGGATRTDVGARVHLHAADGQRDRRQHERADRQQRPRRAEPRPARERARPARCGERDDHPAEAEHRRHGAGARRASPGRAARRRPGPAATIPRWPARRPRSRPGRSATPRRRRARRGRAGRCRARTRAARGRAGTSQRRARPAQTPPSQRPARGRVIGAGSPSSIAMHCRTRDTAFTSRDCPERPPGFPGDGYNSPDMQPLVITGAAERHRGRAARALRRARRARDRHRGGALPARRRDARPAPAGAQGARARRRRPALQARAAGLAAGDRHAAVPDLATAVAALRAARARPRRGRRADRPADDRGRAPDGAPSSAC